MNKYFLSFYKLSVIRPGSIWLVNVVCVCLIMAVFSVSAEPDDLQLYINEKDYPEIRWDNLQGNDEWMQGELPKKTSGQYVVSIAPGESISLLQPSQSWLRMISKSPLKWRKSLAVEQSIDGKLFIVKEIVVNSNNQAVLQPLIQTSVVRLQNDSNVNISFALYRSRIFMSTQNVVYANSIPLTDVKTLDLQIFPDEGFQRYYELKGMQSESVKVKGPVRIEVLLRRPLDAAIVPYSQSDFVLKLDNKIVESYELNFQEDYSHTFRLEGKRISMSDSSLVYINVPAGDHEIEFYSSSTLYVQLNASEKQYLLDGNLSEEFRSVKDLKNQIIKHTEVPEFEKRVLARAKDLSQKDSALYALSEISKKIQQMQVKSWSVLQSLYQLKNRIKKYYTKYTSLLVSADVELSEAYQQRLIRYRKNQLQYSYGVMPSYLSRKFFDTRLNRIGEAAFHLLTDSEIKFEINPVPVDSEFQLLVAMPNDLLTSQFPHKIWLKQDEHPAQLINFRHIPELDSRIKYTVIQKILETTSCCESLLGGLAVDKGGVSMERVASIQLPLKAGVKRIRVWQQNNDAHLWLALQQRRGGVYKLSESQFLSNLSDGNGFNKFIKGLNEFQISSNSNLKEGAVSSFLNHWQPLYRKLVEHYRVQLSGIKPLVFGSEMNLPHISQSKISLNALRDFALQAEKEKQWILALQYWAAINNQTEGKLSITALQHMVKNLKLSGQHVLSRKLQLSIVFSKNDNLDGLSDIEAERMSAEKTQLNLLLANYKKHNKGEAVVALLSAYFVHNPSLDNLKKLSKAMIEEGKWEEGLQLSLLLPDSLREIEPVLLSSLRAGWNDVFERELGRLEIADAQVNKWLGIKSLFDHDYVSAKSYLLKVDSQVGLSIKNWLNILDESIELRADLLSPDIAIRKKSLILWQNLQVKITELLQANWRKENLSIVSHAGQVELFQSSSQIKLMHYVSRPGLPVKLKIAGPVKLKVQTRPVHYVNPFQIKAFNSLYYIDINNERKSYLINQNLPSKNWRLNSSIFSSKGLVVDSSVVNVPGQRIVQDIYLGPGIHELSIEGREDLLIRLQRQYSLYPVSALPQLTVDNVNRVMKAHVRIDVDEKALDMSFLSGADSTKKDEILLDKKRIDNLSALDKLQKMLLKIESQSANSADVISRAEKIYSDSHYAQLLTPTMNRLRRFSKWEVLNSVEKSDGFWIKKYEKIVPESPISRVFNALQEEAVQADEILRNGSKHVVSVFNPKKSNLNLKFKSLSAFFISTENIKISYQIDNNEVQYKTVSSREMNVSLNLEPGWHKITVSVLQAAVNHRLMMLVTEKNGRRVVDKKSRRYQLATSRQALIYNFQGPAWLRIDELVNNNLNDIKSMYRYFPKGDQKLILSAGDGEDDKYYRVFVRKKINTRLIEQNISWLDSDKVKINEFMQNEKLYKNISNTNFNNKEFDEILIQPHKLFKFKDDWKLGRQQSGTTSLLFTNVDQNLILDELTVSSDKYLETELAYRKHNPLSQYVHGRWFYLAGLVRTREEGNNSAGFKSRLRGKFDQVPVDWTIDGRGYVQEISSKTEASIQVQLRLSQTRWLGKKFYHLPKADFFARWLSADSDAGDINVDRDVYSDYKRDHPSGFRLSETLVYRPYQDVEFYTGLTLISNANWVELDQYRSRVGARLQWGDSRWDINARNLQFKADNYRAQDSSRSVVQARVLLEKWFYPRYRFELAAAVDHDVDSGDDTLRIQFSVHQSEGRGYLDYSPSETLFRNLRQAKLNPGLKNEFN